MSSPRVAQWCRDRLLDPSLVANFAACTAEEDSICFPRVSIKDPNLVLSWKVRRLNDKKFYNEPNGIPHRDSLPLHFLYSSKVFRNGNNLGKEDRTPIRRTIGGPGILQKNDTTEGIVYGEAVILCEGESDFLTVVQGLVVTATPACAVAVPGSNSFQPEWADWINEIFPTSQVYVLPDNDQGGEAFVQKVGAYLPRIKKIQVPEAYKDYSDYCIGKGSARTSVLELPIQDVEIVLQGAARRSQPLVLHDSTQSRSWVGSKRDVLSVIQKYLSSSGRAHGSEQAFNCPWHDDQTPSLLVNKVKDLWYCHSCDRGGDAYTFIMLYQGKSFMEAKKMLER
jgi:5S rRNA maturation endonuclease (ribonuclease M5)